VDFQKCPPIVEDVFEDGSAQYCVERQVRVRDSVRLFDDLEPALEVVVRPEWFDVDAPRVETAAVQLLDEVSAATSEVENARAFGKALSSNFLETSNHRLCDLLIAGQHFFASRGSISGVYVSQLYDIHALLVIGVIKAMG
jgi:hypothetical protein